MGEFVQILQSFGFPVALACYLLLRFEKKIDALETSNEEKTKKIDVLVTEVSNGTKEIKILEAKIDRLSKKK